MRRSLGVAVSTLLTLGAHCAPRKPVYLADDQYRQFVTEPHIRLHKMNTVVKPEDSSALEPGYFFVSPFLESDKLIGYGPTILDQEGELVWWGAETTEARAQNFAPCRVNNTQLDHLCYSEGRMTRDNYIEGLNRVFDQSYTPLNRTYRKAGELGPANPHEFFSNEDGKSFLTVVFELTEMDLRPYNGTNPGYLYDGCFQEIDFTTGDALFSWCALDYLYEWETYVYLDTPLNKANHTGEPYGNGSYAYPWDYFHINSVDKTWDGDYIVSARHLNQIIKVAGNDNTENIAPGEIIWKLGGKFNSFNGSEALDLNRQHHARIVDSNATHTSISLFNNQWEVSEGSSDRRTSNTQRIVLNEETMTVEHIQKYFNPEGHVSVAQGSAQVLSNGNMLAGWGTVPQVTEFSQDGKMLFHMHLAHFSDNKILDDTQHYRVLKYPWVGKPTTKPKLLAYSRSCNGDPNAPLVAHVSWNGATEVNTWKFSTSHTEHGPWFKAGKFAKTSFETKAYLQRGWSSGNASFAKYIRAEALDKNQKVLSSVVSETFVPGEKIADRCDEDSCSSQMAWFEYDREMGRQKMCRSAGRPGTVLFFIFVLFSMSAGLYFWRKHRTTLSQVRISVQSWMSEKRYPRRIEEKMALISTRELP